jgi:hypothetical protein
MKRMMAFFIALVASSWTYAQPGDCNLLAQTVASTAIWRDNGVPIAKAQANVEAVLIQMPATPEDKRKWHEAVATIYGSKISSDQLSDTLGSMCR